MKPKYTTYAELAAAFKSGELGKGYYLMLDKGGTENCLSFYDDTLSDEDLERKQEECPEFSSDDITSVFTALGIPWKWC